MNKNKSNGNYSNVKELLMEDYRYIGETLQNNEVVGESRINFFIGLVTAVVAALVAFSTSDMFKNIEPYSELKLSVLLFIVLFALLSLLIIGILTLLRIVKRNFITDGLKQDLDNIRQRFNDFFDDDNILWHHKPFVKQYWPRSEEESQNGIKNRKPGGLAHIVAALNSLIISAITVIIIIRTDIIAFYTKEAVEQDLQQLIWKSITLSVVVLTIALLLHFLYLRSIDKKSKNKIKSRSFTHAGGIVVKNIDTEREYFVVTVKEDPKDESKENSEEWIFPKGHIEDGENHKDTVAREIWEEAGIVGNVLQPVSQVIFKARNETVNAKFYVVEFLSFNEEKSKQEKRNFDWLPFDKAIDKLTFPESKQVLFKAEAFLSYMNKIKNESK